MKVVLQRVNSASVVVDNETVGSIGRGILLLVGAAHGDRERDVDLMVDKSLNVRIFEDDDEKMNLSCKDLKYEILVVSQFTLHADCRKGRRPSFVGAMEPVEAERLYDYFVASCRKSGLKTERGVFGARMNVKLENWGPVTILMDSREWQN